MSRCPFSLPIGKVFGWMIVAGTVGAGSLFAGPSQGNPEAGKKIYMESCQHCHGSHGDGKSEMAGYLIPPPTDLTGQKTQSKSNAELRKAILEGRSNTAMTAFEGALEANQVDDVVAYLRTLKSSSSSTQGRR